MAEQGREELVGPLRRWLAPDDFQAAGDRVAPFPRAELALPAQALLLDGGAFRLRAHQRRVAGVLPDVWPPAMSATVSSSSIAMRANVSRMSRAAAPGS